MTWIKTAVLTLGLFPMYSRIDTRNEFDQVSQDVTELAELALRCGKRRELSELGGLPLLNPVFEYSLEGSAGFSTFRFYDMGHLSGYPNKKVDEFDGFQIEKSPFEYRGNIRHPWGQLFEDSDDIRFQKMIHHLKNNLPQECYREESPFNCC